MDRFTAALRRSTKQKFARMARAALYFDHPAAVNPRVITVCITDRFTTAGDQKGTSMSSAEMEIDAPTIEFLREQIEPARNGYVSVERGLVYMIDVAMPTDDITVTYRANRIRGDKLRNFPFPSDKLRLLVQSNPSFILTQPTPLPDGLTEVFG